MTDVLYAGKGGSSTTSDLYSVNPITGAPTSVGASGFALTGLAWDGTTGTFFGATSANSSSNPKSLITIDPVTGVGTLVGSFGGGKTIADIAIDSSGNLYGWSVGDNALVTINKATGTATVVGSSGLSGTFGNGLSFDAADVLYLFPLGATANYYVVNIGTGGVTAQGALTGIGLSRPIQAASFSAGNICYLLYGFTGTGWLATVDTSTGVITTIADTTIANGDALGWIASSPCIPPVNDDYPEAFGTGSGDYYDPDYYLGLLSGGCVLGTCLCATAEAGEPDPNPGDPATHTVWQTWDATFTGTARFSLDSLDAGMGTGIFAVYDYVTGPPSGLAGNLGFGDTSTPADVSVTQGQSYAIQIDSLNIGGAFQLNWERSPVDGSPPANDDFSSREAMPADCGETSPVELYLATAQCDEPLELETGDSLYNTIWYDWTPTWTGMGTVTLYDIPVNTSPNLYIDIFTGTTLTGLTPVTSHDWFGIPFNGGAPISFSFPIVGGTTYVIRLMGVEDPVVTGFTLTWETDENAWGAKTDLFSVGDASFDTGLGETPAGVIFYMTAVPSGDYVAGARIGVGASDGTDQWCCSYAYPWRIHDGVNGTQYDQQRFSTSAAISLVDVDGSVYAEASVTAFNPDGTVDLAWATNPGDGTQIGFLAVSGIDFAIGTQDYVGGASPIVTDITPGFRIRAFVGSVTSSHPDILVPGTAWGMTGWAENMVDPSDNNFSTGTETGIFWYGGSDDQGQLMLGANLGITYNVPSVVPFGRGTPTIEVTTEPDWSGDFGWVAIGGCGFHALRTTSFPSDFWTQAGLSYGSATPLISSPTTIPTSDFATVFNIGAFDETDEQFDITNLYYPSFGGSGNFQTPTVRNFWDDRIGSVAGGYTSEYSHLTVDLPGFPNPGGTLIRSIPGAYDVVMILLGNYFPPAGYGPVSLDLIHLPRPGQGIVKS